MGDGAAIGCDAMAHAPTPPDTALRMSRVNDDDTECAQSIEVIHERDSINRRSARSRSHSRSRSPSSTFANRDPVHPTSEAALIGANGTTLPAGTRDASSTVFPGRAGAAGLGTSPVPRAAPPWPRGVGPREKPRGGVSRAQRIRRPQRRATHEASMLGWPGRTWLKRGKAHR
jgi:hypothetical protein